MSLITPDPIDIQHFTESEFGEWYPHMSARLLIMLDILRHMSGSAIQISPVEGALGRRLGDSQSAHNIDYWGYVLAADFFISGVYLRPQVVGIVELMTEIGFTGIGVYPEWNNAKGHPQVGFHGDVRPTKQMGESSTWGYLDGKYVSINKAIQHTPLT